MELAAQVSTCRSPERPHGPPEDAARTLPMDAAARGLGCGVPLLDSAALARDLIVAGSQSLADWSEALLGAVAARYELNPATRDKALREARSLLAYLAARGASEWPQVTSETVTDWCWAARADRRSGLHRTVSPATARGRRWVARTVVASASMLGAGVDPRASGDYPARDYSHTQARARPLAGAEAEAVRAVAASSVLVLRAPAAALAFAGGTAAEIAMAAPEDVDPAARRARFGGNRSRVNPLSGADADTIGIYLANAEPAPGEPLCVSPGLDPLSAAHSVTKQLHSLLAQAGLGGRTGVVPRSLRLTTAREILDTRGLAAAAAFLGARSLDRAAEAIGWDWPNAGACWDWPNDDG